MVGSEFNPKPNGNPVARINLEETIFSDRRFGELTIKLKDPDKALGCLMRAWMLAQKWYLRPGQFIPLSEWEKQMLPSEIIEVGLAKIIDGKVRLGGIDEQFKWLKQRMEAGKKGGQAKAHPPHGNHRETQLAVAKVPVVPAKPLYSLLFTHFSLLNSHCSFYKAQKTISPHLPPGGGKVRTQFNFDALYKNYPLKKGKSKGIALCERGIKTPEDYQGLRKAIERYAAECVREAKEPRFILHFSTFMGRWRDWLDPEHGDLLPAVAEATPKKGVTPERIKEILGYREDRDDDES